MKDLVANYLKTTFFQYFILKQYMPSQQNYVCIFVVDYDDFYKFVNFRIIISVFILF